VSTHVHPVPAPVAAAADTSAPARESRIRVFAGVHERALFIIAIAAFMLISYGVFAAGVLLEGATR
jgi:hypothetical protein